jgi:cysteinyl-tRNA synthetase
MHVARLDINEVKMSKSLNNFVLVKEIIQEFDPLAFRFMMIGHHYRQPINYSDELMDQYAKEYDKIKRSLKKAFLSISLAKAHTLETDHVQLDLFRQLMNDDVNTPNVVTQIYDLLKQMNKEKDTKRLSVIYQTTKVILDVLGIMPLYELSDETLVTYKLWEEARSNKDFERADRLRDQLFQKGWM